MVLGHHDTKKKDQNLAKCKWRDEPFTSWVSKALMVNLTRCIYCDEPIHGNVQRPNGNVNTNVKLFYIWCSVRNFPLVPTLSSKTQRRKSINQPLAPSARHWRAVCSKKLSGAEEKTNGAAAHRAAQFEHWFDVILKTIN